MAKIVILGGTGAMGVYLAPRLADEGHDVVVTSRKVHNADCDGVRYARGDAKDIGFLSRLILDERPDAIVDFMIYTTFEFMSRRDILLQGCNHYLFASTYRVFSDSDIIKEDSPRLLDTCRDEKYIRSDEYALAKGRQENLLADARRGNWTIFRPSITFSKARFQFGCLESDVVCYRALQGLPVVMPSEMLGKQTTMTWGGDVAEMLSRIVLNEKAKSDVFNVVTAEHHTWSEISNVYAETIGLAVKSVPLSNYEQLCNPWQVRYDRLFNRVMDNSKVLSFTGLRQEDLHDSIQMLRNELKQFVERGVGRNVNVRQNALIDSWLHCRCSVNGSWRTKAEYWSDRWPAVGKVMDALRRVKRISK